MKKLILILALVTLAVLISGCVQQPVEPESDNICCKITPVVLEPEPRYEWRNATDCPPAPDIVGANFEIVDDAICEEIDQEPTTAAESVCINTGGTWEWSECDGHRTPETKEDRLKCEEGCACTEVCMEGYRCVCIEDFYWGSKEEGCLEKGQ